MIPEYPSSSSGIEIFQSVEPQLLFATFSSDARPVFRNPYWVDVFGNYEYAWTRLPEEDRALLDNCIEEAAAGLLVSNELVQVPVPDRDEPLPVLLNFFPVHDTAHKIVAITVTGEILAEPTSWTASQTHRHRLESLGRMTMGIAHDVNNLLSTVLGYSELIRAEFPIDDTDRISEHLRMIEQAALDGASLIAKIQAYVRKEKVTHFELLDLPKLVQDCVALTRPYWFNEARRQGITIEINLDLNEVPPIFGSAAELREVFVNLFLNAVQAMPDGGSIDVTTSLEPEKGIVITVTDTGTGMSESVRRRIFEPQFTTKGEHGSGMGLAVSYGIVQTHEGQITVASQPGKGTRFEIVFPAKEGVVAKRPSEKSPVPVQSVRILVVDDDEKVRSVLVKLLSLKGHAIEQAASGYEALEILEGKQFDIVFTDLGMPEMNGRQLAADIRHRYPALPIILLTGDTEIGEEDENIDCILGKPFRLDHLQTAIEKLVLK